VLYIDPKLIVFLLQAMSVSWTFFISHSAATDACSTVIYILLFNA